MRNTFKISVYTVIILLTGIIQAQPYNFIQPINPADTGLVNDPARRVWEMKKIPTPITIDGVVDATWDLVTAKDFDRYIMCRTKNTAGVYTCEPGIPPNRTPNNADDFSGSYKITYDEDYLYLLYNVTDNEVNDGVINSGVQERLQIVEAPYPNSAQDLLKGKPYPPFSGVAPAENMKFCYWHYLGAFKMNFFLNAAPSVTVTFDERYDAVKINYPQRVSSCQSAWKLKDDGSGYFLEVAISLKVALADSANNPYELPVPGEVKFIAFDIFMFDKDNGLNQIEASWNAQDDCVWDNMLYTGKLRMFETEAGGCTAPVPVAANTAVCYGKSATLTASGGTSYRWYNSSMGGSLLSTSATFTTPNLFSNTTYYVANYDVCESSRKAVTVAIVSGSTVEINPLKNNHYVCNSAPEQLTAIPSGGVFSGDGVELGYFVPSQAKVNHINSIYYSYGDTSAACYGKDSLHVFVYPCIGLDHEQENKMKIYPNPSDGTFTIEIADAGDALLLQIIDELGRIVYEDRRSGFVSYLNQIDLTGISTGLYLVRAKMEDKVLQSKVIIK